MTAIDRIAYPRLGRGVARRALQDSFTPTAAEVVWARERAGSASHLVALVVLLKAFGRLGYFPRLGGVPAVLVGTSAAVWALVRAWWPSMTPSGRCAITVR